MHLEVKRMAAAGRERIPVRFAKSLPTDTRRQGIVALSNRADEGQKVLPYANGVWLKFCTSYYEGYHRLSHVAESVNQKDYIRLYRRHICQRSFGCYCMGEGQLSNYEVTCKDPEKLNDGTRVLGLYVCGENGTLQ